LRVKFLLLHNQRRWLQRPRPMRPGLRITAGRFPNCSGSRFRSRPPYPNGATAPLKPGWRSKNGSSD